MEYCRFYDTQKHCHEFKETDTHHPVTNNMSFSEKSVYCSKRSATKDFVHTISQVNKYKGTRKSVSIEFFH